MEVKYAQTYSYELVWGEFYPPDGMLLHLEMDGKSYGLYISYYKIVVKYM